MSVVHQVGHKRTSGNMDAKQDLWRKESKFLNQSLRPDDWRAVGKLESQTSEKSNCCVELRVRIGEATEEIASVPQRKSSVVSMILIFDLTLAREEAVRYPYIFAV
jgi:hypothetical protein